MNNDHVKKLLWENPNFCAKSVEEGELEGIDNKILMIEVNHPEGITRTKVILQKHFFVLKN